MPKKCTLVDYGAGNVFSVARALEKNGANVELTRNPERIRVAERLVLPGVGAFGRAADRIRENGLDQAILAQIATGRPFLGICVGMQLLMENSLEFGNHKGLGVFKGSVVRISAESEAGNKLRIPIIGWNTLVNNSNVSWRGTPLKNITNRSAFYFVHSFACEPATSSVVCASARVGTSDIVAAINKDNVTGVQFHPERSSGAGLTLLGDFLEA